MKVLNVTSIGKGKDKNRLFAGEFMIYIEP